MFNCFPDPDARAQARVGPGLATPLVLVKCNELADAQIAPAQLT